MGDEDKKTASSFAVIYLPSEDLYSEIPVSWLTDDKTKCWWPKSINARANMIRGDKPQDNWTLHKVRVEEYCSTLKSARLKAENPEYMSSSSESHKGRGLRKKKAKNTPPEFTQVANEDSSESEGITPPPTPSVNYGKNLNDLNDVVVFEFSPDELGLIGQTEGNPNYEVIFQKGNHSQTQGQAQKEPEVRKLASLQTILEEGNHSQTQGQAQKEPEVRKASLQNILEGNSQSYSQTSLDRNQGEGEETSQLTEYSRRSILDNDQDEVITQCSTCKDQSFMLKEIYVKVTKLEKTSMDISKSLGCLKMGQNTQHFDNKKMELIESLPLNNKEDIINFDQKINGEDNMKETYVNYIKGIGGKDVRDFVNRSLSSLFSNELGKQCSLVGQRGNLRLEGYEFINILQDIILTAKGTSSRYEIEKAIGEWFRLSNQRINRKNTQRQKKDNKNKEVHEDDED